jgi:hypothetical protein
MLLMFNQRKDTVDNREDYPEEMLQVKVEEVSYVWLRCKRVWPRAHIRFRRNPFSGEPPLILYKPDRSSLGPSQSQILRHVIIALSQVWFFSSKYRVA